MKVADQIAGFLADQGLKRVFGIPGQENLPLIEALGHRGVDYVLVAHETGAAYMADAAAYLTGRVQACVVTLGPGACNLVAGMASAHTDNSPILAITGELEPKRTERFKHQAIDLNQLYAPLSKASFYVTAESAGEMLPRAVSVALSEPAGVVRLGLSSVEANREAVSPMAAVAIEAPPAPEEAAMERLLGLLKSAQRPFVMLGAEVWRSRQTEAASRLADLLGGPVTATARAKGVFPENHPLYCGVLGIYQDSPIRAVMDQSDLIVAIGVDGAEFFVDWRHAAPVAAVSMLGPDPYFEASLHVQSDLRAALARALSLPSRPGWGEGPAARCREEITRLFQESVTSAGALSPQGTARILRDTLPTDAIVTTDVGSHRLVMAQIWRPSGPGHFINSSVASAMGGGIPAAVAATLEMPETPVVAVVGDGGCLMTAGELQTLARLGGRVLVVVFNDNSLSSVRRKQDALKYRLAGVTTGNVNFARLAEGFGIQSFRATREAEVAAAVEAWQTTGGLALLDVAVDFAHYRTMGY